MVEQSATTTPISTETTLKIVKKEGTGLYKIIRTSGGKTPGILAGGYTSTSLAQRAIDIYIATVVNPELEKQELAIQKKEYATRASKKEAAKIKKLEEEIKQEKLLEKKLGKN